MYSSVALTASPLLCNYHTSLSPGLFSRSETVLLALKIPWILSTQMYFLKRTARQIRTIKTVKSEITHNGYWQMNIAFNNTKCNHFYIFSLLKLNNDSLATMPERSCLITACWTLIIRFSRNLPFLLPCKSIVYSEN